ncbi:hypothetical protein [Oceaniglobus trochenteri]|uniref:hypothetical protein n=1 Tax=Oceaniglobus trochenteri TaxID=2763260 RepID=UPI001CFFD918|nr:hypothetical protein [Oceaniglobus trochenteri]
MTDLRETIIDVLHRRKWLDDADMADAIVRALPGAIKPLVWSERHSTFWVSGPYRITKYSGMAMPYKLEGAGFSDISMWLGFEAAKAAADAHHRATIMAAFGLRGEEG